MLLMLMVPPHIHLLVSNIFLPRNVVFTRRLARPTPQVLRVTSHVRLKPSEMFGLENIYQGIESNLCFECQVRCLIYS